MYVILCVSIYGSSSSVTWALQQKESLYSRKSKFHFSLFFRHQFVLRNSSSIHFSLSCSAVLPKRLLYRAEDHYRQDIFAKRRTMSDASGKRKKSWHESKRLRKRAAFLLNDPDLIPTDVCFRIRTEDRKIKEVHGHK